MECSRRQVAARPIMPLAPGGRQRGWGELTWIDRINRNFLGVCWGWGGRGSRNIPFAFRPSYRHSRVSGNPEVACQEYAILIQRRSGFPLTRE